MVNQNILNQAKTFIEKHKSIYTGFIHYKSNKERSRDLVPLVENVLYAIARFSTLSKDEAEKGLQLLERLFHFYTENGFPAYIHDYPNVYNDRANVDIFLALSFFLKDYEKVIPREKKNKIQRIHTLLFQVLQSRPLKPVDAYVFAAALFQSNRAEIEMKTLSDYERVVLCKLLMNESVTIPWNHHLKIYTGPLEDRYYEDHKGEDNLFSVLEGEESNHNSCLYTLLVMRRDLKSLISYQKSDRNDIFVNHSGEHLAIHFDEHSIVAQGQFDVALDGDCISIYLDSFDEIDFFFSANDGSEIFVGDKKVTVFNCEDELLLSTANSSFFLKFISTKHPFIGHIMKGNRKNQISNTTIDCILYDHRIQVRKTVAVPV